MSAKDAIFADYTSLKMLIPGTERTKVPLTKHTAVPRVIRHTDPWPEALRLDPGLHFVQQVPIASRPPDDLNPAVAPLSAIRHRLFLNLQSKICRSHPDPHRRSKERSTC
jgi:hypothetical protein